MNTKKFSDAMSELDNKYVDEVINYKKKPKKTAFMKLGAVAAACLALVCVSALGLFHNSNEEPEEFTTTSGIADVAPMVYVNDTLYKQSLDQISYDELKDEFVFLGKIVSDISNDQDTSDGVPKENFQANQPIIGAEVYQYDNNIVVKIDGKYWLYETLNSENTSPNQKELSEDEKMQLDPSYKAE